MAAKVSTWHPVLCTQCKGAQRVKPDGAYPEPDYTGGLVVCPRCQGAGLLGVPRRVYRMRYELVLYDANTPSDFAPAPIPRFIRMN